MAARSNPHDEMWVKPSANWASGTPALRLPLNPHVTSLIPLMAQGKTAVTWTSPFTARQPESLQGYENAPAF